MAIKARIAVALLGVLVLAGGAGGWRYFQQHPLQKMTAGAPSASEPLLNDLQGVLADYRKIIVLLADAASLGEADRQQATTVGQALFHDDIERQTALSGTLTALIASNVDGRFQRIETVLDYIESGSGLFDADRLAFREPLMSLQAALAADGSLPAIKLHKRVGDDLDALNEIERQYDKEISQIFSSVESRAIVLKREKWEDYVAHVKGLYQREQVLKDYGVITPYTASELPQEEGQKEIFGYSLPPKTIALTFDDGPHPQYTDEIIAILKQYGIPGTFFEVGRNIGSIDAKGQPVLGKNAAITRELLNDGYAVGNHSFTHAQLSRESGAALKAEIDNTDVLLRAVDKNRTPIFRFPYGARNHEAMGILANDHLRSILWNIDSLDWADPVPSSVADRVLRAVDKEGHGIILFHDIHDRAVKALPAILDRLIADGYQFAGWDGNDFSVPANAKAATKQVVTSGYANSWAVVIGINDYQKWPKLQYAVNDADAMAQTLTGHFGFAPDHVITLKNGDATRNRILATFHDQFDNDSLKKDDRVFVFFAGHGATRHLSSGRDIGYIIPADASVENLATDAIPMTEIQNIAESLSAKHVFFVMDACYSGLGLERGSSGAYLAANAKRVGRQMLTAGGADQMVADGGPNGHSIFTWTLLQGLDGKADLNGDGLITATELAAYIAPAVASVSQQTPAFGSLPGSQGGDFVFELPASSEFISTDTAQLSGDALSMTNKLDAAAPPAASAAPGKIAVVAPVQVLDLQGKAQTIKPVAITSLSARQMSQLANDRGMQFYREQHYTEAEAQFTEALKLRPDFALAANNLGFVFFKQGKYPEAARWFENTIKLDPSRAVAYLNLGDAYRQTGDNEKARQAYRTYLELSPTGSAAERVRKQLG
jgi:peptidoglycan/xylan/chitin deacetylase (PgdA/CDA1 family)/uncharacterized caspase-like protein/predicted negative regulator of RcsB-dependent stress response